MNAPAEALDSIRTAHALGIPTNVPDARGVGLALGVARELLDRPLFPVRWDTDERERAEVLLGVMTYCYARGFFRSDDVARETIENPSARWLSAGLQLAAREIRTFRRRRLSLVASCLAEFVLRSAVVHPGEAFASEAYRLRRAVAEKHANERLAVAVLNDTAAV